jgi:alpha-mannosidase/mannosylglycerate hydrolase
LEVETKPQQSWTAVCEARRGLAVVAEGLLETAIKDTPERPLALTLFRGTGRTVMTNGEPEGQLLGDLAFRYWLVPLAQAPDRRMLCELGQQLAGGFRSAQLRGRDMQIHRTGRTIPATAGFFQLEGPAVLTSLRRRPEGIEIRLFNPLKTEIQVKLDFNALPDQATQPTQARQVDFESNPIGDAIPVREQCVLLTLRPKQILTVRLS